MQRKFMQNKAQFFNLLDKSILEKSFKKDIRDIYQDAIETIEAWYKDEEFLKILKIIHLNKQVCLTKKEREYIKTVTSKNPDLYFLMPTSFWNKVHRTVLISELPNFKFKTKKRELLYCFYQTEGEEIKPFKAIKSNWSHKFLSYTDILEILISCSDFPVFKVTPDKLDIDDYAEYYTNSHINLCIEGYSNNIINALIHEIAHSKLHNHIKLKNHSKKKYKSAINAEKKEVEAELVSYIVTALLGVDTKEASTAYIAKQQTANFNVIKHLRNKEVKAKLINLITDMMLDIENNLKLYALHNITRFYLKDTMKMKEDINLEFAINHITEMLAINLDIYDENFNVYLDSIDNFRELYNNYLEENLESLTKIANQIFIDTKSIIRNKTKE